MKLRFSLNFAYKLFRRNMSSTLLLIASAALVTIVAILSFATIKITEIEFKKLSGNFSFAIVFDNDAQNFRIAEIIEEIKGIKGITNLNYISPDQAKKEFIETYNLTSEELLDGNFPKVATGSVRINYQQPKWFYSLVGRIKSVSGVNDVLFKENVIKNIFDLKEKISSTLIIIGVLIAVLLILLTVSAYSNSLKLYHNSTIIFNSLGASFLFKYMPAIIYVIAGNIIGLLFGILILTLTWFSIESLFNELKSGIDLIIIYGIALSVGYFVIVFISTLLLRSIFQAKK